MYAVELKWSELEVQQAMIYVDKEIKVGHQSGLKSDLPTKLVPVGA